MKPRTRTLGAIGASLVTAGLVIGLSVAGNSAATATDQTTPTTVSMPMDQMAGMAPMMGSADMSAMHSMMHQMMKGVVDDEVLAACDTVHATMNGSTATTPTPDGSQHDQHHDGTGS